MFSMKTLKIQLKTNGVILEFAVQISLSQPSYFVHASKQQLWEIQEHRLPGLLTDALFPLQAEWMILSSHWNPMGPDYTHTWFSIQSQPGLQHSWAGSRIALSQEHALLSSMWEQQSIDVNVPQSENWNINIKTSNRTKFLELHIKTELFTTKAANQNICWGFLVELKKN